MPATYRSLDPDQIIATVDLLARRIEERFPEASLVHVAKELTRVAQGTTARINELSRPNLGLRAGVGFLLFGFIALLWTALRTLGLTWSIRAGTELIQTLDAVLEASFFIGGSILFLVTLESRLKRRRALAELHELRALAHIVDMHQLTKDPEQLLEAGPRTESSPARTMTNFELSRYLDYSTEMLAMLGKIAALYSEHMSDPVVLSAVDEVEELTTGLSGKIWGKIALIDQIAGRRAELAAAARPETSRIGRGTSGARRRARRVSRG
ncbi:MAG: hypothetical protein IPI67_00160 [Myxococcales bacterium]|nr:hypothetical protein [Myxococcales bacterium]